MKIFFSMPTDLYPSSLVYKDYASKTFPLSDNIIRMPSDYMDALNKATEGMKKRDREKYISAFCLKKVEECDILIYTNTYTKDGNILFTRGVRGELNKGLELGKIIYRLYLDNGVGNNLGNRGRPIKLQKMDISYFSEIVNSHDYEGICKEWALKSVNDYIKFYDNNPEMISLIQKQFESKIGKCISIPHHNYVYDIDTYGQDKFRKCSKHGGMRHSILLPKQEFTKICPFTEDKTILSGYSTVKLKSLPLDMAGLSNLLVQTRTLHKLMYILEDRGEKCDYSKEGIAYINEEGKIPFVNGKPVKDYSKIIGVRPLFDIDIKDEYKQIDSFFQDEIFNEYQKTIDLFFKYYDVDKYVRCMFSGNGLYIDLGEKTFDEFDCSGFEKFDSEWSSIRKTMQGIMNENGIKRLQIEKGYGWNRYFKVGGTFHAKSERISIPLNINESLDKEWIKKITNIALGLEENVSREIINRAGNNWR